MDETLGVKEYNELFGKKNLTETEKMRMELDKFYFKMNKQQKEFEKLKKENEVQSDLIKVIREKQQTSINRSEEYNRISKLAFKDYNITSRDLNHIREMTYDEKKVWIEDKILPSFNKSIKDKIINIKNLKETDERAQQFKKTRDFIDGLLDSDSDINNKVGIHLDDQETWLASVFGTDQMVIEDLIKFICLLLDLYNIEEVNAFTKYNITE